MSEEIEKELLKKILLNPVEFQVAIEKQINPELFQSLLTRKMFEIGSWFFTKYNFALSTDSLSQVLDKSHKLSDEEKTKLKVLFSELESTTFEDRPAIFLTDQLRAVYKKSLLKHTLITAVNDLENKDVDKSVASLRQGLSKIELARDDVREGFFHESADDRGAHYLDVKNNPEKYRGILTGWPSFDITTNGVRGGQLFLILAGPKEGKSTGLVNIAYNALITDKNVLYISVEMPREQVERRFDALDSQLSYRLIRDGKLDEAGEALYDQTRAIQKQRKGKLYIIDSHDCNTAYLRSKISTFPHPIDLVVIDYLTLVKPATRQYNADNWKVIGDVAEEVRNIGREFNLPIWSAAQANRSGLKEAKYKYGIEDIALSFLLAAHVDGMMSLRFVDRDELEVNDVVEMTAATVAIRDDKACRFTIDACFDKFLMKERELTLKKTQQVADPAPSQNPVAS